MAANGTGVIVGVGWVGVAEGEVVGSVGVAELMGSAVVGEGTWFRQLLSSEASQTMRMKANQWQARRIIIR